MEHSWAQGCATILSAIDHSQFQYSIFPRFEVAPRPKKEAAMYCWYTHTVTYNKRHWGKNVDSFTHTYFHELVHSTSRYSDRFERFSAHTNLKNAVALEERIADLGGLLLASVFDPEFKYVDMEDAAIPAFMEANHTEVPFPWGDFVAAVLFYLNNKRCPKVTRLLKLYKATLIANGYSIQEGYFGRSNEATKSA